MTKYPHGGRRPGSGPKPKPEARYTRKTITLPPDVAAAVKAAQQPGESFSECVARLVVSGLDHSPSVATNCTAPV
jgi:hypothetical protein